MPDDVKVEMTEEQKHQAEYEAEWKAAGDDGKQTKDNPLDSNGTGDGVVTPDPDKDKKDDELNDTGTPKTDADATGEGQDRDKDHGSLDAITKALNDTKAYATRIAQELADLKKSQEKGGASAAEVAATQKKADDAQADIEAIADKIYEDYPELKPLVDLMTAKTKSLETEVTTLKKGKEVDAEKEARAKAKTVFEETVKPKILEKHKDFDAIIKTESYWEWAKKQRPGIRFMAMDSDNPDDISTALTEFKKSELYKADIDQIKEKDKTKRDNINNAQALRGGSTSFPAPRRTDTGKDDYEAGWREGEEEEKRAAFGR